MNINEEFQTFSQNTEYVCSLLSIGIFLVFVFIITPLNLGKFFSGFGKLLIILILGYALYKNFGETHNFLKNIEGIFDNPDFSGIRNNMLLSHLLSLFILILVFYVLITIFV
jgi:hypothetical protein